MTMTWIDPRYLRVLMDRAAANTEPPDDPQLVNEALQYAAKALDGTAPEVASPEPLPDGEFGRVELPGYRHHTGWVTDSTRAGVGVMVVRDWDGRVLAEVFPGGGSQFVHLPTPLKRPEPQRALTAGAFAATPYGEPGDGYDDDQGPF